MVIAMDTKKELRAVPLRSFRGTIDAMERVPRHPLGRMLAGVTNSLFGRLFRYARSTGTEQLENFTTEALAAAIRVQPGPFVDMLTEHGILPAAPHADTVLVATQEVVPGVGIIDLVVRLFDRLELRHEIWVEAKVWAAESGDQLTRYRSHIQARPDAGRCRLVTLGPRPVSNDGEIPWLSWQALRDTITMSKDPDHLWLELGQFLEETNVADEFTEPITAREAASLLDASTLFRKATRVLAEVSESGLLHHPEWGWGSKEQVAQLVLGRFQRQGQYAIATGSRPVYLVLGYAAHRLSGEAYLTIGVENDPRKAEVRQVVLSMAESGGLDGAWVRRLDTWQALAREQRATTIEGLAANVDWFERCLAELEAAGVKPLAAGS